MRITAAIVQMLYFYLNTGKTLSAPTKKKFLLKIPSQIQMMREKYLPLQKCHFKNPSQCLCFDMDKDLRKVMFLT